MKSVLNWVQKLVSNVAEKTRNPPVNFNVMKTIEARSEVVGQAFEVVLKYASASGTVMRVFVFNIVNSQLHWLVGHGYGIQAALVTSSFAFATTKIEGMYVHWVKYNGYDGSNNTPLDNQAIAENKDRNAFYVELLGSTQGQYAVAYDLLHRWEKAPRDNVEQHCKNLLDSSAKLGSHNGLKHMTSAANRLLLVYPVKDIAGLHKLLNHMVKEMDLNEAKILRDKKEKLRVGQLLKITGSPARKLEIKEMYGPPKPSDYIAILKMVDIPQLAPIDNLASMVHRYRYSDAELVAKQEKGSERAKQQANQLQQQQQQREREEQTRRQEEEKAKEQAYRLQQQQQKEREEQTRRQEEEKAKEQAYRLQQQQQKEREEQIRRQEEEVRERELQLQRQLQEAKEREEQIKRQQEAEREKELQLQ
eukprot:3933610-Rhodomonas_salina.1